MATPHRRAFPLIEPQPAEAAALRQVAVYLRRAGTSAATEMLTIHPPDDAPLRLALRDNLLAAADLCDGLVDLMEDGQLHRA